MKELIIRRALASIPVILILTAVAFSLVYLLPGDAADLLISAEDGVSKEKLAEIQHELGLDRNIVIQYFDWLDDVLRGDLGYSLRTNLPIIEEIKNRAPVTIELGILASLVALLISIPIGVLSAARQKRSGSSPGSTSSARSSSTSAEWRAWARGSSTRSFGFGSTLIRMCASSRAR